MYVKGKIVNIILIMVCTLQVIGRFLSVSVFYSILIFFMVYVENFKSQIFFLKSLQIIIRHYINLLPNYR